MAEPTLEQLRELYAQRIELHRQAEERGDRLYAENVELEQEMADIRTELLREKELRVAAEQELESWRVSDLRIRWIVGIAAIGSLAITVIGSLL